MRTHPNTDIAVVPTLLLCDLDREHFVTDEEFEVAVTKTIANFEKMLGVRSTLLWTGSGVHFNLPQSVIKALEKIDDFNQFPEPSRKIKRLLGSTRMLGILLWTIAYVV